ncbi:MAG: helix-turn-helix transcriptional regulator, partial [Treponema sp.]|nr:helix-turn-helix transcriptional regulator [Treponema sp.]
FPLLYGDAERLKRALQTIFEFSEKIPCITEKQEGVHIEFYSNKFDWQKPELLLAEKIILLQYGEVVKSVNYAEVVLPWPNLAGQPLENMNGGDYVIYCFSENLPAEKKDAKTKYIFDEDVNIAEVKKAILLWEPDSAPIDEWVKVYGLRHYDALFRAPILCYSHNMIGHNFIELLEQKIKAQRSAPVLFVNTKHTHYGTWATDANSVSISSMQEFDKILDEITPSLIVFESIDEASIRKIRQNQKTVLVPIIVLPDTVEREEDIELLCSHPRIILCNRGAAESEQFDERIKGILAGDEILPPHTGALVKKAILYLNKNASQQIVRWKLADTVHVSEDYLTRIFHKEIGLSLWEYLNRYRIYIATKMLLETNDTIYEIAENSGFQDQAYFCRVFKKIYGVPPGKIRSK